MPDNGARIDVITFVSTSNSDVAISSNAAYIQANASNVLATSSYTQANAANNLATSSYAVANNAATTGKSIAMAMVFGF